MGVVPGISFALAPSGAVEALECLSLVPYHASYDVAQLDRPKSPPALKYRKPNWSFCHHWSTVIAPPFTRTEQRLQNALSQDSQIVWTPQRLQQRAVYPHKRHGVLEELSH